ncbi:ParB/RepB/Spo0J family partition protein [Sphingobium sp. 3R8]|uniref:ParB/RepB/Spo0J family partition protein n=1 Tax=Sphingobium sp. 3R8 TaxID=2874921 RepID=UPI001CCB4B33|nr:ParB/RepB/Spo0J family partition protein [Sphingobium sp. 3R8]MBZ9649393.1 ParB/RepB/Spo0J family partition protein [Sphingobium sp. 3R8]
MELKHIDIACLSVSPANMRGVKKQPDLTNILPSVRARGILVPLIVRAGACPEPVEGGSPTTYEIVAGKRRYHAALAVAQENGGIDPLPCAVMEAGDDAAALEASLIENIARLDPDEVTRWESFTRLVKEGRSPDDIALTFGLTSLQVKRTLALGNLLPRIRTLYRNGAIDAVTVRHLTLASRPRQREWLALLDDGSAYAPTGHALKSWLMGGQAIAPGKALFDLSLHSGEIVADLFGEDSYFADATQFWQAQEDAINTLADDYREAGWADVLVLARGETFHHWEHVHCPKKKGGRIYITVGHGGDVAVHEGYISQKEARRLERGDVLEKPVRPELSTPLASYVDLHRHAAVRAKVATAPTIALRVMVAHAISGSSLWRVDVAFQRGATDAISESVETCASETAFDSERRIALDLLGLDPDTPTVTGHRYDRDINALFARLLAMDDPTVMGIFAVVMAETLEPGSAMIETLGRELDVNMASVWETDNTLLDLIRDREVMNHVLADVAGADIAEANAKATVKVQRGIVHDCLTGSNGRGQIEGWVPRWMQFPPSAYTTRGGVGSVEKALDLSAREEQQQADAALTAEPEPERQAA